MKFYEVVEQVRALLQRQGRVSYRALKREFDLDDDYVEDLKAELIEAQRIAADEDGKVLVWIGEGTKGEAGKRGKGKTEKEQTTSSDSRRQTLDLRLLSGERRQLTVMFCDLVGSTALSEQLDPEELRRVIGAYQELCAGVIGRFGGHIAQYLGDGLLVYFGYPAAHEDDAQRAVRAGLEVVSALQERSARVNPTVGAHGRAPLRVRIGIHTGQVVVGEIGGGEKREHLALGDTPNIAARVQGMAEPNAVLISAATQRLVEGLFECRDLGPQQLKGLSTPLQLYHVERESVVQSRFEAAISKGLTPLVGRDGEVGLRRRHWERAKEREGQVVLVNGEAGIGKSRLAQELQEQAAKEGVTRLEFRCSPYHQNSALYPVIDFLQRTLGFARKDSPQEKLRALW